MPRAHSVRSASLAPGILGNRALADTSGMETAGQLIQPAARPTRKLIEHCSTWQPRTGLDRHTVWARLEDELGDDFAHRLVNELVEGESLKPTVLTG